MSREEKIARYARQLVAEGMTEALAWHRARDAYRPQVEEDRPRLKRCRLRPRADRPPAPVPIPLPGSRQLALPFLLTKSAVEVPDALGR